MALTVQEVVLQGDGIVVFFDNYIVRGRFKTIGGQLSVEGFTEEQEEALRVFYEDADPTARVDMRLNSLDSLVTKLEDELELDGKQIRAETIAGSRLIDGTLTVTQIDADNVPLKLPVVAATTASGTLASDFEDGDTIDGVTLATGDRILIKDQGSSENGIYTVNASGAPTRATDLPTGAQAAGVAVFVQEGTANGDSMFLCTDNDGADVVGTDTLTFVNYLQDLQSDVTTLQSDVTTLQSDVTTLQSDVTTLQSDVTTLQSDVTRPTRPIRRRLEWVAGQYGLPGIVGDAAVAGIDQELMISGAGALASSQVVYAGAGVNGIHMTTDATGGQTLLLPHTGTNNAWDKWRDFDAGHHLDFACSGEFNNPGTNGIFHLGFKPTPSDNTPGGDTNEAYFRWEESVNSERWQFILTEQYGGAGTTIVDTGIGFAGPVGNLHEFRISISGEGHARIVTAYIDEAVVFSKVVGYNFHSDLDMIPFMGVERTPHPVAIQFLVTGWMLEVDAR